MKTFLIIGLFLITACSGNKNPDNQVKKSETIKSGITEFVVNKEIHNFGEVISGEIISYTFIITNEGNSVLEINEIDEGCGCIQVKTKNIPIAPGEKGNIEVTFDSAGLYGHQFKTIGLKVNTLKKTKDLAIAANVINENIKYK